MLLYVYTHIIYVYISNCFGGWFNIVLYRHPIQVYGLGLQARKYGEENKQE